MDSWVILSSLEQSIKNKIEAVGTPLREWDINIYRGVLTGYNDAFIIDSAKREEILLNCKTEEERLRTTELIRPILRGRDIKRYSYDWAELWLIYIPWHFPLHKDPTIQGASKKAEDTFKMQYPAVYQYLIQYKPQLSARNKAETGIRYEWYAMQRWGANYSDDFNKPKITWGNLNINAAYALVPEGFIINAPSPFIAIGEHAKALLHILNSNVADYYIRTLGVTRNGGYFEYKPMFIEQLPVPKEGLQVLEKYSTHPTDEEYLEIEQLIYKLYNLSDIEIQLLCK